MVTTTTWVTGVRPTVVALSAEMDAFAERATAGLVAAGKEVQTKARANVASRRYDGRLHDAITVQVHIKSLGFVSVTVGVHGRTFAPEGKTFEVGWRSAKGLQPPTAPIAEWVMRRHIASDPKKAHRIGFLIARAQGRRGYSFGELHWLSDAWRDVAPMVEATVARYAISSFASQPRASTGRWLPS